MVKRIKMNRCLYLLPYPDYFKQFNNTGGHVSHFFGIFNAFIELGISVTVLLSDLPKYDRQKLNQFIVVKYSSTNILYRQLWIIYYLFQLSRVIKRNKPHFCYLRYSFGILFWLPFFKLICKNIPIFLEINTVYSKINPLIRFFEIMNFAKFDRFIVVSDNIRSEINRLSSNKLDSKIKVVYNGVAPSRFPHNSTNIKNSIQKCFKIGYFGILKPDYDIENLIFGFIKAHESIQHLQLDIYGDGPLKEELIKLIIGYNNINYKNNLSFEHVPSIMVNYQLLCGTGSEIIKFQSPIKLFEYLASGVPILYADNPQVVNILKNGSLGTLYSMGNSTDIAEKILYIYHNYNDCYEKALVGRNYVINNHTWLSRAKSILKDYL